MIVLRKAAPRTVGTHFAVEQSGHRCRPACYRVHSRGISTLCEAGHSTGWHDGGPSFGGSAFEASLNNLPASAPYVMEESTQ